MILVGRYLDECPNGSIVVDKVTVLFSQKESRMSAPHARKADASVDPLFINRWSPRAYTGEQVPDAILFSVFEAARWAASARNAQPWRFVYTKRGTAIFDRLVATMSSFNQQWVGHASAIIALLSAKTYLSGDMAEPNAYHSFDAGAAWANLSLQANMLGWHTHAIGAFDRASAATVLKVPESYAMDILIAIGKIGRPETLPNDLRGREVPTERIPLRDMISEDAFRF